MHVDNNAIFFANTNLITVNTDDISHDDVYHLEYKVTLDDHAVSSSWLTGMTITIIDPCTAANGNDLTIDLSTASLAFTLVLDNSLTSH